MSVDTELAVLLDIGSAWAKAGVIGRVRGRWRLVTTVAQPTAWGGSELRRRLVERLEATVDPRLRDRAAELVAGANRIECHTARRAARLGVVAVSRELSGSAARRAAEAAGWLVTELVTLDDGRALADRLAALQALEVDAWVIAGGFDGARSPRAMEAAALVAAVRRPGGGPVIWAGSADLVGDVAALFEADAFTAVANLRPDARREDSGPLRDHLQALLRSVVAGDDASHLSAIAMPRAIGALARARGFRILGIDVGARAAVRALAEPDGSVVSRIHAGGGLMGLAGVAGGAARVARLAPEAGDEAAIADLLQTLRARPATLPQTPEDLAATQAAARVQVGALVDDGPVGPLDLIIGAGSTIAAAPTPSQAVRMLLDGVRPIGVTQLAVDAASLLGPLGSLPDDEIAEGVGLLGEDLLVPLGTAVVSRGGDAGRVAVRVTMHRPGWPDLAPVEVRTGQVQIIPLARGQVAELTIEPGDGVSVGATRRSPRIHARASGGAVGVVIDARGVPMALPRRGDDRRAVLAGWREALSKEPVPGVERIA